MLLTPIIVILLETAREKSRIALSNGKTAVGQTNALSLQLSESWYDLENLSQCI
jgi:hypothetical protein